MYIGDVLIVFLLLKIIKTQMCSKRKSSSHLNSPAMFLKGGDNPFFSNCILFC